MRVLLLCAGQESTIATRSRWTQSFAIVFTILALGVAWSGYIFAGGSGAQDFARTAGSLMELVVLLVPLAALILGVQQLTPDAESELLYSQPEPRGKILLGRMIGLLFALSAAQMAGFGAAGLVIFWHAGTEGIGVFLLLLLGAILLTAIFLALAAAVVSGKRRGRARHLAIVLVIWFAAAILFDVAALAVASLLPSGYAARLLIVAVIVNPIDAVRTAAGFLAEGTTAFGAASLAFLRFTRGMTNAALLLLLSLVVWTVVPALLAMWRVKRADL